jgi:hypothetical protein
MITTVLGIVGGVLDGALVAGGLVAGVPVGAGW